jgi:hypothetical protein
MKFPYIYDYSNLDKAFGVRTALAVRRLLAPWDINALYFLKGGSKLPHSKFKRHQ